MTWRAGFRRSPYRAAWARVSTVTATLLAALWLVLVAAEACPELHEWLHGGHIPEDDECAVVLLSEGKVQLAAALVFVPPVAVFMPLLEAARPVPHEVCPILADARGPPTAALFG